MFHQKSSVTHSPILISNVNNKNTEKKTIKRSYPLLEYVEATREAVRLIQISMDPDFEYNGEQQKAL